MRGDIIPPQRQSKPLQPRDRQLPPVVVPPTQPVQDIRQESPLQAETTSTNVQPSAPPPVSVPTPVNGEPQNGVPRIVDSEAATPVATESSHTASSPKINLKRVLGPFYTHKKIAGLIAGVIVLAACLLAGAIWYQVQLSPVNSKTSQKVRVTVPDGSGADAIAKLLKREGVIRNEGAFKIYLRLSGKAPKLQSGAYRLSTGDDVPAVVSHLTSGKSDTFSVTFLPGATLSQHRKVLIAAGYTAEDVDAALATSYSEPLLFDGKPAGSDLEGYIYGETYQFAADATPAEIIKRSLDQYEKVIEENKLKDAYAARGFTVYQGLTLASIIQREVATPSDAAQVAQVFELRLKQNIALGSDVTYQYIADKTGQGRSVDLDSPYNTRRYRGLPPGPISSPGIDALRAVGYPAQGDYVYFLSGDDDKTYFARTNEEHEANIRLHCQKKCQII